MQENKVIALAGNPNVGKSTVFNQLTGLNQHTGNWVGKTVATAKGECVHKNSKYTIVDLPGTYSLMANSKEEEVARNFICFKKPDVTIVVCDATCLERNLNLVLQIIEITNNVVLCVNLIDEAKKKNINIDIDLLSKKLGIQVIATSARNKKGLDELMDSVSNIISGKVEISPVKIKYTKIIEDAINIIEPYVKELCDTKINSRWLTLKLIEGDESLLNSVQENLGIDIIKNEQILDKIEEVKKFLELNNISLNKFKDIIVSCLILKAEEVCLDTVTFQKKNYNERDRKIDKILTNKLFGIPIMIFLLAVIFWLTIVGANYPSQMLSDGLFFIQNELLKFLTFICLPDWIINMLVFGVYQVLAWVVSVMLPPMAIFFPLFTLLEDLGYLPRIAFNLDKYFKKACACGKQALTM